MVLYTRKAYIGLMTKSTARRRKPKIAIAPLAGFILGLLPGIMYMKKGYDWGAGQADVGGWKGAGLYAMEAYLGLVSTGDGFKFDASRTFNGLVPLVGLSLLGWGAHKLAVKLGVNKNIPWVSI